MDRRWVITTTGLTFVAACIGGQTGEESAGRCWDNMRPVPLGEETRGLGREFAGKHELPLYWVDRSFLFGHAEPEDGARTDLTVEVSTRDEVAIGFPACGSTTGWSPVDVTVKSADRRIDYAGKALLDFLDPPPAGVDGGAPSDGGLAQDGGPAAGGRVRRAMLMSEIGGTGVWLRGRLELQATLYDDGDLRGKILGGGRLGWLYTACGGRDQLALGERPASPAYSTSPVPMDALDAVAAETFMVEFDAGHVAALGVRFSETSDTACWGDDRSESPSDGFSLEAKVELIDADGRRVAASPARLFARGGEFVAYSHVGDRLRRARPDEPIADDAFQLVDVEGLTGGAGTSDIDWFFASFRITMVLLNGQPGAAQLEVALNTATEGVNELHGTSAR